MREPRDPKPVEGGHALLFERLVDEEHRHAPHGEEARPLRAHDRGGLKESVRRELRRLLNTRCNLPLRLLDAAPRTVLDYGVPDFSSLSAHSGDDQKLIASVVASTVAAFEPRLREVRVTAERAPGEAHALRLQLEARLVVGTHAEPVSFSLYVHPKTGEAEAYEHQPE